MSEQLLPVQIPPGVVRNGTEYAVGGRWYDSDKVRFFAGQARPLGGWTSVFASPLAHPPRAMLTWRTNSGAAWAAIGHSAGLFVSKFGGTEYDITPVSFTAGADNQVEGAGYGTGSYGGGTYGDPATTPVLQPLSVWHLDTWGENLVGCMNGDGKIYEWTLATASPAAVVTNAPTGCIGVMVTEQRHMMALGASSNPRLLMWSDKEANTVWTPGTSNEAGDLELQTPGAIKQGLKVKGYNLILTDVDAHRVEYIGYPLIYSRKRVGNDCGTLGQKAGVSTDTFGVWMGHAGWWIYDGTAVRPLDSDVQDYVYGRMNPAAAAKVACGHNGTYGEIWWWYPGPGANEPDSYVVWNYRENHWTIGSMDRTCWTDIGAFPYPYGCSSTGYGYRHEDGLLNAGASMVGERYLRSGAFDLADGVEVMHVRKIIPDEKAAGAVNVTFYTRYTPMGTEYTKGPYTIRADGYTDARFSGRQMCIKLANTDDSDWRIGKFRLEGTTGGNR